MSEELGILRKQIKEEARSEVASQTDFMQHKVNASIQADGPDTFVWDGIVVVPKDVTKVRIADGVTRIEPWIFHIVIY